MERAADRIAGGVDTARKCKRRFSGDGGRRGELPIAKYCRGLGCSGSCRSCRSRTSWRRCWCPCTPAAKNCDRKSKNDLQPCHGISSLTRDSAKRSSNVSLKLFLHPERWIPAQPGFGYRRGGATFARAGARGAHRRRPRPDAQRRIGRSHDVLRER